MYEFGEDEEFYFLIYEYCNNGTLFNFIKTNGNFV